MELEESQMFLFPVMEGEVEESMLFLFPAVEVCSQPVYQGQVCLKRRGGT